MRKVEFGMRNAECRYFNDFRERRKKNAEGRMRKVEWWYSTDFIE